MGKSINKQLKELYEAHLGSYTINDLKNAFGTDEFSQPLLMYCWEEEYLAKDNIKILFVGKCSNSWYPKYNCCENNKYNIQELIKVYITHELGINDKNSLYWQMTRNINNAINTTNKGHNYLSTNVFKFGQKEKGKGDPPSKIRNWEKNNLDIFLDEVNIVKPDVIIFITGTKKCADKLYINQVLGKETKSTPYDENIAIIQNPKISVPMFRLARPDRRIKNRQIINQQMANNIIGLIKKSLKLQTP